MVSKNNMQYKQQREAQQVPHYGLRRLSVGVVSVLLGTTLYLGVNQSVGISRRRPVFNDGTGRLRQASQATLIFK